MIQVDGRETNPVICTLVSHQLLNSNAALESDVFLTISVLHACTTDSTRLKAPHPVGLLQLIGCNKIGSLQNRSFPMSTLDLKTSSCSYIWDRVKA